MGDRVRTRVVAAVALIAVVVAGGAAVASARGAPNPCTRSEGAYGKQCETVSRSGLTVTGIEVRFSAPDADFFTGHTWTFETTTYACDPRGRSKADCAPEQHAYGSLHRGNEPIPACTSEGTGIDAAACSGSLNFSVPRTFAAPRWVCSEVAVWVQHHWVDNGSGLVAGTRACNRVR